MFDELTVSRELWTFFLISDQRSWSWRDVVGEFGDCRGHGGKFFVVLKPLLLHFPALENARSRVKFSRTPPNLWNGGDVTNSCYQILKNSERVVFSSRCLKPMGFE